MIINPYLVLHSIDPDAQAFIDAELSLGIFLTPTEKDAINQLVLKLKGANIWGANVWNKGIAFYPFIGGTASAHKLNLKNPLDSDAAFRILFLGGWTHSSTGALPNGSNSYGTTYIVPATHLLPASKHLSYYSRTSNTTQFFSTAIGCDGSSDGFCRFTIRQTLGGNPNYGDSLYGNSTNGNFVTSVTDAKGYFISTRLNADNLYYKNGVLLTGSPSSLGTNSDSTRTIRIAAADSAGTIAYYDNKECAFASVGFGLTSNEVAALNDAVYSYQVALGRQV